MKTKIKVSLKPKFAVTRDFENADMPVPKLIKDIPANLELVTITSPVLDQDSQKLIKKLKAEIVTDEEGKPRVNSNFSPTTVKDLKLGVMVTGGDDGAPLMKTEVFVAVPSLFHSLVELDVISSKLGHRLAAQAFNKRKREVSIPDPKGRGMD